MASASECISTSAKNDEEKKPKNETTNATNGDSETNSLPDFEHGVNTVERKSNDGKATMLENGQHVQSLYDEKRNEDNDTVESVNERLNGDALNDNQADGNSEKSNELVKNNGDEKATMSASNDNDDDAVKAGDEKGNDKSDNEYEKYEILSAEEIDDTQTSTTTIAPETTTTTAEETTATTSGEQTTAAEEGMATLDKETTTTAEETATTTSAEETATTTSAEETTTAQTTTTTAKDETATTTENTESKENTTPPRSQPQQRHSPNNGSPERGHHTGGCHKFPDEESRAEYMKIKSEVTGGAETSESEDEEEMPEHTHPGSHTSPDAKTKAEYRKIKYEITGEALTSESEDESSNEGEIEEADEETEKKDVTTEWMDIFGNGRLKRRILRKGKGRDTRPDRGQIVMIQTAGRLSDGTAVDWNQCLEFILGEGEVIQAWDVGVALVELDEVCELVTDARYAYGEQGREGDNPIPPNAKITYEIELLAVRDGPDMDTMSDDERIKIGDKKKELGNDLFARGDYSGAINCYQRAIKYLTPSSDEQVQELRLKCWNNLSATQIKIKAHSAALSSCQQVLAIDPDNVKALFRKGKVLAAQGELKEAVAFVKKASLNEPGNKTIRTELTNLKRQLTSQNQEERNMYERMVGGLTEKDKNTSKHSILPWSLVFGATVVVLGGIVAALYVSRH